MNIDICFKFLINIANRNIFCLERMKLIIMFSGIREPCLISADKMQLHVIYSILDVIEMEKGGRGQGLLILVHISNNHE